MIQLRKSSRSAKLAVPQAEAGIVSRLLGEMSGVRYDPDKAEMLVPLRMPLLEILVGEGGLKPDRDVKDWYQERYFPAERLAKLAAQDDAEIDHPHAHQLYPYQRVGARFLRERKRALLCDECGLGKTLQTIVAVESSGPPGDVLVLCLNSLKSTWLEELNKWAAYDTPVTVFDSADREDQIAAFTGGWAIVNYRQFLLDNQFVKAHPSRPTDWKVTQGNWILRKHWDWVICDEAHKVKNRKTKTYAVLKELDFDNALMLTGTPMGNDPSELWALLHFLYPEEYTSYWRFYEMYVDYFEGFFGREVLGVRNERYLRRDLASRMVLRRKEEVMPQLPDKTYQDIKVGLHKKQAQAYQEMAQEMLLTYEDGTVLQAVNTMSMILRLRQILSTTATLGMDDYSEKLSTAMDIIESTNRGVLVFTQYRATVDALCDRLQRAKIPHARFYGGMTDAEADAARHALNDGEARVLVCTLQAGGVGLNLTGASTAIFIEKHWNPVTQTQAEDRIHRIGQTEKVHIISLVCPSTVDDLVERILKQKVRMIDAVLQEAFIASLRSASRESL